MTPPLHIPFEWVSLGMTPLSSASGGVALGTVPDWVSVIGTLAAVGITVWVLVRERREKTALQKAAKAADAVEMEARKRKEASGLTWWIADANDARLAGSAKLRLLIYPGLPGMKQVYPEFPGAYETVALVLSNTNASCLYKARLIRADYSEDDFRELGIGIIPPGLSSGEVDGVAVTPSMSGPSAYHANRAFGQGIVKYVEFSDSHNQRWRRYADGRLEETDASDVVNAMRYY